MGFDDGVGDGQSQAGAGRVPADSTIGAIELMEELGQVHGLYPDAVVLNADLDHVCHHGPLDQRAQVDRSDVELAMTGLETLQRHGVVDQGAQPPCFPQQDPGQETTLVVCEVAGVDQLRGANNAREGIAEVVAQQPDQFLPGMIGYGHVQVDHLGRGGGPGTGHGCLSASSCAGTGCLKTPQAVQTPRTYPIVKRAKTTPTAPISQVYAL